MTKCPNCGKGFTFVDAGKMRASVPGARDRVADVYSCPHCHVALSAQIETIVIRSDIVSILAALGRA